MNPEPNVPVLVGVGVSQQRIDDADHSSDAAGLMAAAVENATRDAGSRFLANAAQVVLYPRGTWGYADPTPLVLANRGRVHSIVGDIGVLQQSLIRRACELVSSGQADVVIVCGGEAKYRALQGVINATPVPEREAVAEPSERLVPSAEIITREEIERGLTVPARQYALIDTALRNAQGLTRDQHRQVLGELWARFSSIAAANPDAWIRRAVEPEDLQSPSARNPYLASPYTKQHCSQWNVDQAAALIICSTAAAVHYGVARDRWIYPHVGIESNHMVSLTNRADPHRSPAVAVAAAALHKHAGVAAADVDFLDLYSCFPAAVRVQQAEFGIGSDRPLTVTGGMTFGGGPLNNYTLQATAKMAEILRTNPASTGLVTNVSGMLTKFGLTLWSCTPPAQPFRAVDISDAVEAATPTTAVDSHYRGVATTISYTVAHGKGGPEQGIVLGKTPDGQHCLATTTSAATMRDMVDNDWCAREITVSGADLLS